MTTYEIAAGLTIIGPPPKATTRRILAPRDRQGHDVTSVVHAATDLLDVIAKRGRGDVVGSFDVDVVRSTFLDEVVWATRDLAEIKRDDIGRAAEVVIAAYDDFMRLAGGRPGVQRHRDVVIDAYDDFMRLVDDTGTEPSR